MRFRARLATALAAVAGAVLLSGCDYWDTCVQPPKAPTPFTLVLRAFFCGNTNHVVVNPIVPQFQIHQVGAGGSLQPVTTVPSGSLVSFDPTTSYIAAPDDRNDEIQSFSWDFHGHGQPMPFPNPSLSGSDRFWVEGRFFVSSLTPVTITLTVLDSLGLVQRVSKVLTVYPASSQPPGPDTPPMAAFTVNPNPAGAERTVAFDGSATSDRHGIITDYKWDFGDGTPVVDSGAAAKATHTYACTGRLTVTLTATNDGGQTGQGRAVLFVTPTQGSPPCPGSGPAAAFTASPNPTMPEGPVTFDASASSDAAGTITDYFWEFGDGTHGDSASPTITHDYFCTGTVTVKLTITDGSSMTDQTTSTETVTPSAGFMPCSPGGAADVTRGSARTTPGSFFTARFVHARVLALGAVSRRGATTTLRGLLISGNLRGNLVGSGGLARFNRARFIAALTIALDAVRHVVTLQGVALAGFPGAHTSQLCLRLDATKQSGHLPIGSFRALGGAGAAARLSGGGTFVFALGPKGGRLAGRLRVDNSRRAGRPPLPAVCRSLLR